MTARNPSAQARAYKMKYHLTARGNPHKKNATLTFQRTQRTLKIRSSSSDFSKIGLHCRCGFSIKFLRDVQQPGMITQKRIFDRRHYTEHQRILWSGDHVAVVSSSPSRFCANSRRANDDASEDGLTIQWY